jgi:hypothetical protein
MMALVLKNIYNFISQYGKREWKFVYTMVSKKMLAYGGNHLTIVRLMTLSNEAYEKLNLDKWSHAKCKDKESTKGLFSCGNSILQVHGCIQQEKVIVSINPSCNKILSMFSWLIDCKFLQRIFKTHRLRVKMFIF